MRNVRPSWVDIEVDGRDRPVGTGPRRRDGSMRATFYVRSAGKPLVCLSVSLLASPSGDTVDLVLEHEGLRLEKRWAQ